MKKTYIKPETLIIIASVDETILTVSPNQRQTAGEDGSYDIGGGVTVIGDDTSSDEDDDDGGAMAKKHSWNVWDQW